MNIEFLSFYMETTSTSVAIWVVALVTIVYLEIQDHSVPK